MAIRRIIELGESDVLRKRARKVEAFDERLTELLRDMAETMTAGDGAGLAAPQVGVLKCCVVIDVGEGLIELINPEIVQSEGEMTVIEGCLSVPGRAGRVVRPERVTVRAQDRYGEPFEIHGEGPGGGRDDDARGYPRNGFRPERVQQGHVHGRRESG